MARIFIDSGVFGESWFKDILGKLRSDKRVRFSYTSHRKMQGELELAKKLGKFYKIIGEQGRRDDVSEQKIEARIRKLLHNANWCDCAECDDPHIFALVHALPTKYVFTADKRLAKCRKKISGSVDSKFCRFRSIQSKRSYTENREIIHA